MDTMKNAEYMIIIIHYKYNGDIYNDCYNVLHFHSGSSTIINMVIYMVILFM